MLILKRASKSRPGGEWSDDDYDVFDGDLHIGRIMTAAGFGRSRRGCRNTRLIAVTRRAVNKRCRISRRGGA
jgi:hypothetical protein